MRKIDLVPKVSKFYLACILGLMLSSCLILLWVPFLFVFKLAGIVCCLIYGVYSLKQAHCIRRIQFDSHLGWQIHIRHGLEPATLIGDSTVTRYVSVLRFRIAKRKYSAVLFKHNTDDYVQLLRLLMALKLSGKLNPVINDLLPEVCVPHQ